MRPNYRSDIFSRLISSYETHIKTAIADDEAGYHHSAQVHKDNAQAKS